MFSIKIKIIMLSLAIEIWATDSDAILRGFSPRTGLTKFIRILNHLIWEGGREQNYLYFSWKQSDIMRSAYKRRSEYSNKPTA